MNIEIKERLESTLEKYGISKAKASRDMGYSAAVISAYMSGNYGGDVEKLEEGITQWIARQEQAHSRKRVAVVETSALKTILNAIELAHTEKDIALIVAPAGSGKTKATELYVSRNEKTVIYIPVIAGMGRMALVREIAKQLSLDVNHVQLNVLVQNVADALSDRNSVVILDEADYLKSDALEFVRRIVYDLGRSGLVLIGLPQLQAMIQNLKNDHRQLESRIGILHRFDGLTKQDAVMIARSVWDGCGMDVINAIYAVSKGDVRQYVKIIERAQNTMAVNKLDKPDVEVIEIASTLVLRRRG